MRKNLSIEKIRDNRTAVEQLDELAELTLGMKRLGYNQAAEMYRERFYELLPIAEREAGCKLTYSGLNG